MKLPSHRIKGTFVRRLNRFAATVTQRGKPVVVHVANSGRMRELLRAGATVYLRKASNAERKTGYDLSLVQLGKTIVSVDSSLPGKLLLEAFKAKGLPQFHDFSEARAEMTYEDRRLDLLFTGRGGKCYVETKSVTLVRRGVAIFPDAPTERGRKHLGTLAHAKRAGHRAAVVFVIQRPDAIRFRPNEQTDPDFCKALRSAIANGVEAYAYACDVSTREVSLSQEVEVSLHKGN